MADAIARCRAVQALVEYGGDGNPLVPRAEAIGRALADELKYEPDLIIEMVAEILRRNKKYLEADLLECAQLHAHGAILHKSTQGKFKRRGKQVWITLPDHWEGLK